MVLALSPAFPAPAPMAPAPMALTPLASATGRMADRVCEPAAGYDAPSDAAGETDGGPINRHTDPMRPPARPRAVTCLHCGQRYRSNAMRWVPEEPTAAQLRRRAAIETELLRIFGGDPRQPHPDDEEGRWRCPTPGCDGAGYLLDIHPA